MGTATLGLSGSLSAQTADVALVLVDSVAVRPILQALWDESVTSRRELVACIGGYRAGPNFRIKKAADLRRLLAGATRSAANPEVGRREGRRGTTSEPAFESDSVSVSRTSSELSVEVCRPPQWVGTIHTHRVENGVEYPGFSSDDRAVISLWHARWRRESVFCVLFSRDTPPYCEYKPGA